MLAMSTFVSPQIFLVSLLAGWLNQEQQKVLEFKVDILPCRP